MSEKIKVFNPQKFDIGVRTLDKPMGFNIKAGSFAQMTEDDVSYISSVSTLFRRGMLRVEAEREAVLQEVGIDVETDPNFISDEEIKKKLSGTPKKIETWLETVMEPFVLDRIFDVAKAMDLSVAKIRVLQEKMPARDFQD